MKRLFSLVYVEFDRAHETGDFIRYVVCVQMEIHYE